MKMDHTDVSSSSLRSGFFFFLLLFFQQFNTNTNVLVLHIKDFKLEFNLDSPRLCLFVSHHVSSCFLSVCVHLWNITVPPPHIYTDFLPLFLSLYILWPHPLKTSDWARIDACMIVYVLCRSAFFLCCHNCVCVSACVDSGTWEAKHKHAHTNCVTIKSRINSGSI